VYCKERNKPNADKQLSSFFAARGPVICVGLVLVQIIAQAKFQFSWLVQFPEALAGILHRCRTSSSCGTGGTPGPGMTGAVTSLKQDKIPNRTVTQPPWLSGRGRTAAKVAAPDFPRTTEVKPRRRVGHGAVAEEGQRRRRGGQLLGPPSAESWIKPRRRAHYGEVPQDRCYRESCQGDQCR
jgi:hypothetical protein